MIHGVISPIKHLEEFTACSGFDFALAHIVKESEEYKKYFQKQKEAGRFTLVDNGIFENGVPMGAEELLEIAIEIDASEVVAPDILKDKDRTIEEAEKFIKLVKKSSFKGQIQGVAQGANVDEWVECYKGLVKLDIDCIAIPFDMNYNTYHPKSITLNQMYNRQRMIKQLIICNIVDRDRPHHLLGLSDPYELEQYTECSWIRSNDSSCAVIHGMNGVRLTENGLCGREKIRKKLDFYCEIPKEKFKDIYYNIVMIERIMKGEER